MIILLINRFTPETPTETDLFNAIITRTGRSAKKYELTKKLCRQFVDNHAKRADVTYESFSVDRPECHMNEADHAKFASIMESVPQTSGLHLKYKVEGGIVRYIDTNNPVKSNSQVMIPVFMHENKEKVNYT